MNSPVVIDANLAVYSVLNTPHSQMAERALEQLAQRGAQPCAPGLWWYEVTSVIHRYHFAGLISDQTAYTALDLLTIKMGVQPIDVPARAAFDWATRLHQKSAYDGFYLAAAERLEAEFWTADQALVHNVRKIGAGWIHWMGEA